MLNFVSKDVAATDMLMRKACIAVSAAYAASTPDEPRPTDQTHTCDKGLTSENWPYFKGAGLFELISTINHSCVPNCVVSFNGSSEATIRAVRSIAEGEELSICYVDSGAELHARQSQLATYGFECVCKRCATEKGRLE